jgi:putative Ca2+/H+ antiporter (TMEM165/GDT1 family)
LSFPVFIVSVFVAMEYSSWWPVIALPVLGIIVTATALTLPSTPITHASAKRAQWAFIYGLIFIIVAVLIAALVDA